MKKDNNLGASRMNILVISSSMRSNSQSIKVSKFLSERVLSIGHSSSVLDLHTFKLPIFDNRETELERAEELSKILSGADGFVFVSPEWDGMMSVSLLNMIHYVRDELSHKPVMLVGVSSGLGGVYPISQMRQMGQKNKHYVIIPENLRVAFVGSVLNADSENISDEDTQLRARADYSLKVLSKYSEALKNLRTDELFENKEFENGV